MRNPREVRAGGDGNPRAIRPKTCIARKWKTACPVELTAGPRAPTTENQNGGASRACDNWQGSAGRKELVGSSDDARASTRRAPDLGRVLAPRLACARVDSRETTHSSHARFPLGPDATRAEGRATARRAFLPAASDERVFTRRAHRLRGVGWPAPSRPRSPRAPHPRARVERADPAAASSGTFASRPRPTGLSHPSTGLAPRRDALPRRVARVFAVCRRARLTPFPPPALHTQPSRVQTVHRRRERPSRPRGRPSRPTRTPPPRAYRGRATGRRHRYRRGGPRRRERLP